MAKETIPELNAAGSGINGLVHRENHELRRSVLSPWISRLYRMLQCQRRWRIGRILLMAAIRLEGGPMRSATARKLMAEFHRVEIGSYSYGDCFDPAMPGGIKIGRYTSIATGVRMFLRNHPLDHLSTHPFFYENCQGALETVEFAPGRLEVGHDVWIGCNALIMPGCHRIGNGAVIGAGAIVTKNVPDFAIVVGNPAKRIRDRFSEIVMERIRQSRWWELSLEELRLQLPQLKKILDESST